MQWLVRSLNNIFTSLQFFPFPFFILWGTTTYKVKGHHQRKILNNLQVGDVIMRRYDRYVTAWFIPGYWKHVGIYVGDNKIVHAMTRGVIEEDILTYLRADQIAILRVKKEHQKKAKQEIGEKAKSYIGRSYDFDFNTVCNDALYCSELIKECYKDYPDLEFKVKEKGLFSKGAIPPDYLMNAGFEVIYSTQWEQK
jgi:uncharacterized protein YycO